MLLIASLLLRGSLQAATYCMIFQPLATLLMLTSILLLLASQLSCAGVPAISGVPVVLTLLLEAHCCFTDVLAAGVLDVTTSVRKQKQQKQF